MREFNFEFIVNPYTLGRFVVPMVAKASALEPDYEPEKGLEGQDIDFQVYGSYNELVGHFFLAGMPGCCGIVISHHTYVQEKYRRSGLSAGFREFKSHLARQFGYTAMVATTQMDNIPAVKNMFKSNYEIVKTFKNKRTNNLLGLGYKLL